MEEKSEESLNKNENYDHSPDRVQFLMQPQQLIDEDEEEEKPPMLEPDHPLLEKFQKALKEHLERQIEHLTSEVFELETGAKKKNIERENLGIEAYEAQQLVSQQQIALEKSTLELKTTSAAREQIEEDLDKAYKTYKDEKNRMLEAERKENELRQEVESLNLLIYQMSQWENDVESELSVNQRISEKTKKDKIQLAEEKRQQDMFIYKLMKEVWRLEGELETLDMQLRVKEEEREKFAESISAFNIDIEAFESEYRCLLHSWNSVIVTIGNRDKHFTAVNQELNKARENLQNTIVEIESLKKMGNKEMMRNEELTMIKSRVDMEIKVALSQTHEEMRKRNILERQMNNTQAMIDQIENDIQRIKIENQQKTTALNLAIRDFEKLAQKKVVLDEEILLKLEDQLTNDKAAKYLNKMVKEVREKCKDMEITLAASENKNARVLMDTEAQKCMNEETQRLVDELQKQQSLMDAEIAGHEDEVRKTNTLIIKKQRNVEILTKKIDAQLAKTGNVEVSPGELKIKALEREIEEIQEKNRELQKFWLREQGHMVSLSQQRQEQIYEFNMLRKQMILMEQKNLKISDELENFTKQEDLMTRNITNFHFKLKFLSESLGKKRGSKENLGKDNDFLQFEFIVKLKDAEMECLKIEAEIAEFEEDKINLSNELMERNRDRLGWEKKVQMAIETKRNMDKERGEGGEVGNMKAEIHRMHVRLSQLKKAQDKLIHDMEHCISRRDAIVMGAQAREKRTEGGIEKTRVNFTRKLDDMRNKLKQIQNEIESTKRKIENQENESEKWKEKHEIINKDIEILTKDNEDMEISIERAKTDRQLKLEMLVLKQKKLNMHSDLSKGRTPYTLYRTESVLHNEYEKQREINSKLTEIVEHLMTDFPNHYYEFYRLFNTLKLPIFVMLP